MQPRSGVPGSILVMDREKSMTVVICLKLSEFPGNTVRDFLVFPAEMSIGLDLDWIGTIANFVEFGLDPDCKSLQKLGFEPDLVWIIGKEMRHFRCEKAAFFKFVGLHLDLDFIFEKKFGLWLDLDWVLKNLDWIWIAKYDSPLISDCLATLVRQQPKWNK